MNRSRTRAVLLASFVWVLLVGAGAYLSFPTLGPIAVSVEPNLFWSIKVTGIASAPFRVELKTAAWFSWTVVPVALLWIAAFLLSRRSSRA